MQRRNNRQGHPIDHYPFSILILLALGVPFIIFGLWPINSVNFNRSHPGPIFFGGNANPMKVPKTGADYPPILAYTIFGSKRDSWRMLRILKSIYHPRNQYLLYLDERAPNFEREKLRSSVESQKEFCAFGNVYVINKNQVKLMGASSLPAVLHAATLLLSMNADWDWFTALSPSDYPLIPQDGKKPIVFYCTENSTISSINLLLLIFVCVCVCRYPLYAIFHAQASQFYTIHQQNFYYWWKRVSKCKTEKITWYMFVCFWFGK